MASAIKIQNFKINCVTSARSALIGCVRWSINSKHWVFRFPLNACKKLPGTATLGRPHLADALVEKKIVRSRKEAFQKYLNLEGSAYVPGEAASSREVIALIRGVGGVPVLAHPAYYCNEPYLKVLVDEGLMGLEVYYPDVSRAQRERFLILAAQFHLIATGGSDYHGPRTSRSELACVNVPDAVLEELEKAKQTVSG